MKKYLLLALIALVAAACSKEEEDKSLESTSAYDVITPENTLGLIGGTIDDVKTAFRGFRPYSESRSVIVYKIYVTSLFNKEGEAVITYSPNNNGIIESVLVMYKNPGEGFISSFLHQASRMFPSIDESFFGVVNPKTYAYGQARSVEDFTSIASDQRRLYFMACEFKLPEKSVEAMSSYDAEDLYPKFYLSAKKKTATK